MLISIITPTFNRPERLLKALGSLRAQTYEQWEAVVVDDGDGRGKELAESLGDSRIRALQNPVKGQIQARNLAINSAQGEVIAWLDDDDWFEDPGHLAQVATVLSQQDVLVHRHGWLVSEQADEVKEWLPYRLAATRESMFQDNTILTSSIAYPQRFHDELGDFDLEIGGYFDWDWSLRVLKAGYRLHTIESLGVCYLLHSDNGSAEVTSERRQRIFKAFCDKHDLQLEIKNHAVVFAEQTGQLSQ